MALREVGEMRFTLALALLMSVPVAATAQPVDWKLYGGATVPVESSCFYDAAGVTRTSGHVRVWTKCLPQNETEKVDSEEIVKAAGRKIAEGYVPPLAEVVHIDFDGVTAWIVAEQIANMSNIEPNARIFYEIGCSEKMVRQLSLMTVSNGRLNYDDRPREFHIAPETNVARLTSLLCR
jgi:hypothetical protein